MNLKEILQKKGEALEDAYQDALQNSAMALSQLTGEDVDLIEPRVELINMGDFATHFDEREEKTTLIRMNIYGGLRGDILILLSCDDTKAMVEWVTSRGFKRKEIGDLRDSLLVEMGNIVASNCINVLGDQIGEVLIPSVPHLSYVVLREFLDGFLVERGKNQDYALMLACEFVISGRGVKIVFLYLVSP